jgi:hypothetical protein
VAFGLISATALPFATSSLSFFDRGDAGLAGRVFKTDRSLAGKGAGAAGAATASSFFAGAAVESRSRLRSSAGGSASFFGACATSVPDDSGFFARQGGRTANQVASTAANPNAGANQRARQSQALGRNGLIFCDGAACGDRVAEATNSPRRAISLSARGASTDAASTANIFRQREQMEKWFSHCNVSAGSSARS